MTQILTQIKPQPLIQINQVGNIISRSNNGSNEKIFLQLLIKNINEKTPIGSKIRNEFHHENKFLIDEAITSGGSMSDHYDISFKCSNNKIYKIECKHTSKLRNLSKIKTPWQYAVQVLNGIGSKFIIGQIYAKSWYDTWIATNILKNEYDIKADIPSFEEWCISDAFVCGDPKTPFGLELKKCVRDIHGPKSSLNKGQKNGVKYDYRKDIIDNFNINDSQKNIFIKQCQEKLESIFAEKDYFLTTSGDINDESKFNFRLFDKTNMKKIKDVEIIKGKDIKFKLIMEDNSKMNGILRFGKGAGFSNIRVDFK